MKTIGMKEMKVLILIMIIEKWEYKEIIEYLQNKGFPTSFVRKAVDPFFINTHLN